MGYADIETESNGLTIEARDFLTKAGDQDLLDFFRFLPIVGDNFAEPVTLGDLVYEMMLWPYVKKAAKAIEGEIGIPSRLKMISDIMRVSEDALEADTGKRRRVERSISLPAFLSVYSGKGLTI